MDEAQKMGSKNSSKDSTHALAQLEASKANELLSGVSELMQAYKMLDKARGLDSAGDGGRLPVDVGIDGVDIGRVLADVRVRFDSPT